jgi:hypothetical protein
MADDENAFDVLQRMLREWGLEELAPEVLRLLQDGYTQEQASLLIQDTDAYKRRFQGNDLRRKAGLAALSPGEYLATEASYRRIMESAGLPAGFYDQPSDFASWIGSDVAPTEVQTRVNLATDAAMSLDAGTKQAFWDYYRVGENDLAAFFLDRDRALPHIQNTARAAKLGGYGYTQGVGLSQAEAERLATSSIGDADLRGTLGTAIDVSRDAGRQLQLGGCV